MRIEQLMPKPPKNCQACHTLREAAQMMRIHDCGCLPITADDGSQRVVGMITDRDICMAALFHGKPLSEIRVGEVMTKEVRACNPGDALREAAAIMGEARVRRLPVVDEADQLLGLLSVATIYTLRHGPLPLTALIQLGALFARLDDHLGFRNTVVDHLFDELLRDFTPERRQAIEDLLGQMQRDASLLGQLTPAGANLLNALTVDRPGTRYGSVVCATPPPGLRSIATVGLDPYAQATHALERGRGCL